MALTTAPEINCRTEILRTNEICQDQLDLDAGAGAAGGTVDGLDEGHGFAAFGAVADGFAVCANRPQEVFEDFLVAANIGNCGGGGAWVCVLGRFGGLLG
jgi:hypothetical protein